MSNFPIRRLRRLRKTEKIRDLVKEVSLSPKDLICPVFVEEGIQTKKQIQSMPAIERLPLSDVVNEVDAIAELDIPAVMLFGIPQNKDDEGTSAFVDHGIVQKAITEIRKNFGNKIVIMSDVCLCQYTLSGHCGLVKGENIDNDSSIATLSKIAVSQAKAGVDVVSPSAMMDGQVHAIRSSLDDAGFSDLLISDPADDDLMFLLENFAGDDITTQPNNLITENHHDKLKEYDLFINFEETISQEDLIYISELG